MLDGNKRTHTNVAIWSSIISCLGKVIEVMNFAQFWKMLC
jgi:hypothetical protein